MHRSLSILRLGVMSIALAFFHSMTAFAGPAEVLDDCGVIIQMAPGCVVFEPNNGGFFALDDSAQFGVGDEVHVTGRITPSINAKDCPFLSGSVTVSFIKRCDAAGVHVDECGTLLDQTGEIPQVTCARFLSDSGGIFLLADLGGFEVGDRVRVSGFGHGPCSTFVCGIGYDGCFSFNTIASCATDLNGDGVIDGIDLGILLLSWSLPAGSPGCAGSTPCHPDINGDGHVDGVDLGILLNNWTS